MFNEFLHLLARAEFLHVRNDGLEVGPLAWVFVPPPLRAVPNYPLQEWGGKEGVLLLS